MTAPDVLAFADRKSDGAYAVTEPSGSVTMRQPVERNAILSPSFG
ncbi:hypothetical protein [Nocardioides plantarum]|uniref:Uncharacterized protein n=1 Tax=Nocardioides plantarum TaxID=29299 RepID=A0ABV5KFT1_9ACTN|nr:hypothetical protein [Nocardioides plantarum]